jgi:hypothetical protein
MTDVSGEIVHPERPTSEYLDFEERPPVEGRKTKVVVVRSAGSSAILGDIRWFGRWRQYTFQPERGTVFNQGCLATINAYMAALMEERRG